MWSSIIFRQALIISDVRRNDNNATLAKELALWQIQIAEHWSAIYMQNLQIDSSDTEHHFSLHVYLDDLSAGSVRVEIYANGLENNVAFCQAMERKAVLPGAVNGYLYETTVPADRPAGDYTPRLVAGHCHANIPAEEAHIKWYR